jgi:hypothetical protein
MFNSTFNQINTSPGQSLSRALPHIAAPAGGGELSTATEAPQYSHTPTMHPLEPMAGYPVSLRVRRNSPILCPRCFAKLRACRISLELSVIVVNSESFLKSLTLYLT